MEAYYVVLLIFQLLIFVVGIPGNLLILQVFVKKTRKTSTNVFIMALASADLLSCILRPVYVGFKHPQFSGGDLAPVWIEMTYDTFNVFTVYSSAFLTAAIAFDRYDAVCRPHTRLISYRGAKIVSLICFIVPAPMAIPSIMIFYQSAFSAAAHIAIRKAKHGLTLSAYIFALVMVIVFYIRVYRAVLFRTRVRTKWGHFNVIPTAAAENSFSVTGQTEISALPPARDVSRAARKASLPTTVSQQQQSVQTVSPATPGDLEVVSLSEDQHAVTYRNVDSSNSETVIVPAPPHNPNQSTAYTSLSPEAVYQGPLQSSSTSGNLKLPISGQTSVTTATDKTGSTKKQRTTSERGKSSKSMAVKMQIKTTRMLLITTIVFLMTWIPYVCTASMNLYITIAQQTTGWVGSVPLSFNIINLASHLLYLNNAANPFIYVLANRQFRIDCEREVRKLSRSCFGRSYT